MALIAILAVYCIKSGKADHLMHNSMHLMDHSNWISLHFDRLIIWNIIYEIYKSGENSSRFSDSFTEG